MKTGAMIIRRLAVLFISSAIIFSCTGKQEKPGRSGLIPEKELIPILTEIHIADGILANPKIRNWVLSVDSVSTYYYIAEKHGYTKEALDKTMRYYFIRKPKKLIRIYDKILGKLSEMESRFEKEAMNKRDQLSDIWPGERNYYFPDVSGIQSPDFKLTLTGSRLYNLKFTASAFPDDQSVNARARVFSFDADSVTTGKRYYYETPVFIKDSRPHTYTIRIFVASPEVFILEGSLFETGNNPGEIQRHISFENITLSIPTEDK